MPDQQTAAPPSCQALARSKPAPGPLARNRRICPAAGLAGLGLYLAGSLTAGMPQPGAPAGTLITHLNHNRDAVLSGTLLMFLALPCLLLFLGYLWNRLTQAEGSPGILSLATVAAWLLLFATVAIGVIPVTAVAWRGAAGTSPAIVRLVVDIASLSLYSLSAPVAAASVLAPSLVIWKTRMLPRWLVLLGLAEVAVNGVELSGLTATSGANAAGYAAGTGPLLWIIWTAAVCVSALAASQGHVLAGERRELTVRTDPGTPEGATK
ncbi:MAG: hypothetical protein ACLQFR_19125 [Streptosporangiaceae bacterium]